VDQDSTDMAVQLCALVLWAGGVSENGSSVDPETLLMFPIVWNGAVLESCPAIIVA
jgi:hypothetical protein